MGMREGVPAFGFLKVNTDLDECWAMDNHWAGQQRTRLGDLLYTAKYTAPAGDPHAASLLAQEFGAWCAALSRMGKSRIGRAQLVVPVPPKPRKPGVDLPWELARAAASGLGIDVRRDVLRKWKRTPQVKSLDRAVRPSTLDGVFTVDGPLPGMAFVVVDDLVMTGSTFGEIARVLRRRGARLVIGLAATRAHKGLTARPSPA